MSTAADVLDGVATGLLAASTPAGAASPLVGGAMALGAGLLKLGADLVRGGVDDPVAHLRRAVDIAAKVQAGDVEVQAEIDAKFGSAR